MNAAQIHAQLAGRWPQVLAAIGIDAEYLRKKRQGPCPACGGTDRFCFDDRKDRGDFICRGCGTGDGFTLVMRILHCDFATARRRVLEAAGLRDGEFATPIRTKPSEPAIARPNRRVLDLLRTSCDVESLPDAMDYLASRKLLPLPAGHALRGHAGAEYFDSDGRHIGHFAALLAPLRDVAGELVTAHVTYLKGGRKLQGFECRKLLSRLTGHSGCAVRLMPTGPTLGIAEGVETALSANKLDGVPVWAATNANLLSRFEPPQGVLALRIYGDRDEAGLTAACRLMELLQGRVHIELRTPAPPAKDWNDVLNLGNP